MQNFKFKALVILLISILMFGMATSSVGAKEKVDEEQKALAMSVLVDEWGYSEKEAEKYMADAVKVSKSINVDKNGYVSFDSKKAKKLGLSQDAISQVEKDFKAIEEANDGKLNKAQISGSDGTVQMASGSCYGLSFFDGRSSRAFFDTCDTRQIIWELAKWSAALSITGLIIALINPPLGASVAITGVLVGLTGAYVAYKDRGCGIFIYWSGTYKGVHSQTACSNY